MLFKKNTKDTKIKEIKSKKNNSKTQKPKKELRGISKIFGKIKNFIAKIFRPIGKFLSKIFTPIGGYFKGSWQELKQVRWPNRSATWSLTGAVILFTAIFIAIIVLLDAGFDALFNLIVE